MDADEFEAAIKQQVWKRRDRWHIDTGDHTLVRAGVKCRDYAGQFAFLLRRKALIESVRNEANQERRSAGRRRRKESRRRRR